MNLIYTLISILIVYFPAFSQSLSEPQPKIHCSHDGNWYSPEEYNIYCKPLQQEKKATSKQTNTLSPYQQIQLQIIQSMLQPIFNSLFNFNSFSQKSDTVKSRKQEEIMRAWDKYLEEAERQAKLDMDREKAAGQQILSRTKIGDTPLENKDMTVNQKNTFSLYGIDWDKPREDVNLSNSQITTDNVKEQLLRTVYFLKMSETALLNGDLDAAYFWSKVAFEGDTISPREIKYNPSKELLDAMDKGKIIEMRKKVHNYSTLFSEMLPKIEYLQNILVRLEQTNMRKKELHDKLVKIEHQIKSIKDVQQPDSLQRLLSLKQETETKLRDIVEEEKKLLYEREKIYREISELKSKITEEVK